MQSDSRTADFIIAARNVHGDKYDYSQVICTYMHIPVKIICPIHGVFSQQPKCHIKRKQGCPRCGIARNRIRQTDTNITFVNKAINIHGDYYDYSRVNYIDSYHKVIIICRHHGEFNILPGNHINQKQGCSLCRGSSAEVLIANCLIDSGLSFTFQHKFDNCISPYSGYPLFFDFYIPQHNTIIEYHGSQHYIFSETWHKSIDAFARSKERDACKFNYAVGHGYRYLVIPYTDKNPRDTVLDFLSYMVY